MLSELEHVEADSEHNRPDEECSEDYAEHHSLLYGPRLHLHLYGTLRRRQALVTLRSVGNTVAGLRVPHDAVVVTCEARLQFHVLAVAACPHVWGMFRRTGCRVVRHFHVNGRRSSEYVSPHLCLL